MKIKSLFTDKSHMTSVFYVIGKQSLKPIERPIVSALCLYHKSDSFKQETVQLDHG